MTDITTIVLTEKELLRRVKFLYKNFESLSEKSIDNRLHRIKKILNHLYKKYSISETGVIASKIKDGCKGKWYECDVYLTDFFYYRNTSLDTPRERNKTKLMVDHLYKILTT